MASQSPLINKSKHSFNEGDAICVAFERFGSDLTAFSPVD